MYQPFILLLEVIKKYFPELTSDQVSKFSKLRSLYSEWNEKVNLISRKDIDYLYERHVLHSLSIAKFISFKRGTRILDVGTGGGFPGIPLAIYFPDTKFHLIDSTGKKINAVKAIADGLGMKNVSTEHTRAENLEGSYDYIVSRAVASLLTLYNWTKELISSESKHSIPNGWIVLKGGNLNEEIHDLKKQATLISISDFFDEDFFQEKFIVYFHDGRYKG